MSIARSLRGLAWVGVLSLGVMGAAQAQQTDPEAIVKARCASCHERLPDGSINRISHQRKTPEGWRMTIFRMNHIHGSRVTPEETSVLVKWLSDNQGLAPEETAPFRYILERTPNVVESPPDEELATFCARCHSYARVGLQRRDAAEWTKLVHFHLGQWPTTEYQALGRDREWFKIASTQVPAKLGKMYGYKSKAWTDWMKAPKADLSGTWAVSGHRPGVGTYGGTATIAKAGDGYTVTYDLRDAAGNAINGTGKSIVYSGYEWRGTTTMGKEEVNEVFAASKDGSELTGRWFLTDNDEIGATFHAVRADAKKPMILAVSREHLKVGESAQITVWGAGLNTSKIDFGPGVTVKAVGSDAVSVTVEASADAKAAPGNREITVGGAKAKALTVYNKVDSVKVEPEFAIARLGGNGPTAPVTAQFEAIGFMNGKDGKPGTKDDVRIGVVPATWSLDNFNEPAVAMKDVEFAGAIDKNGLFMPTGAGPNPKRAYGTNNVGDLKVIATVDGNGKQVTGEGHLITTVQRWNDPPIR